MATIVTRSGKGSALSHTEMDNNVTNLNTDKAELGGATFTGTVNLTSVFQISGATVSSTAAELNILDGGTITVSELNTLTGILSSTAELNILNGVTSSTAELNILNGVTSTSTELNVLDGIASTTTELNYVNGVTSAIQAQLNTKYSQGGTDVAVSDGGTGSSTASGARSNLGLAGLAVLNTVGTGQIDASSVTSAKIATDAVGADEISAGAVGTSELAAGLVSTEYAGIAAGAIGSLVLAMRGSGGGVVFGNTYAGSGLYPASMDMGSGQGGPCVSNGRSSTALSGTWRALGYGASGETDFSVTLFVRIS